MRIFESLEKTVDGNRQIFKCKECGYILGPTSENYKEKTQKNDSPQTKGEASYLNPTDKFIIREYCCPGCGVLFEVEVIPKEKSNDAAVDYPSIILF